MHRRSPSWTIPLSVRQDIERHFADRSLISSYAFVKSHNANSKVLEADLKILDEVPFGTGCPARDFGMSDTVWQDPNPAHHLPGYVAIPGLCDMRRQLNPPTREPLVGNRV